MAQSFKDWLGVLVESELEAVIKWKNSHAIKREAGTEDDSLNRFGDDGSNFQSAVGCPPLGADSKLQIIQVLAIDDTASVLLSDGFTSVRATLSAKALAALEEGLDEKLSLDMKGDVISLSEVVVTSTPYGTPDGFVQLIINSLEYHYALRKIPKGAQPVQERGEVLRLLDEITNIRQRPYEYEDGDDESIDELQRPEPSPKPGLGAARQSHLLSRTSQANPLSRQSPEIEVTASSQLPQPIATQLPSRKRPRQPSLATEGFEIEAGINLARPSPGVAGKSPTSHQPRAPTQSSTLSTDTSKLLGLLAKNKPPPAPAPLLEASTVSQTTPKPGPAAVIDVDAEPTAKAASPPKIESSKARVIFSNQSQAAPASSPPAIPPRTPRPNYARRKPSKEQRSLLDRPQSWFPSLPSHTFPSPNVPIQLLAKWKAEIPHAAVNASQSSTPSSQRNQQDGGGRADAVGIESSDSSSDEELGQSQWPESSPQRPREELPIDSSASVVSAYHGSQPNSSRPSSSRAGRITHAPRTSNMATSGRGSPHAVNNSADTRQPPRQSMLPPDSTAGTSRPSTAQSLAMRSPLKHPLPTKPPLPSSGLETVIKGTQFSAAGDAMEMDVPRALPDPSLLHRQRRTEHFRNVQQRDWLKANYVVCHQGGPYVTDVLHAYEKAHPKDPILASEIGAILKEVFPELRSGFPPKMLKPKIHKTTDVPAATQSVSVAMDGTDDDADAERFQSEADTCRLPSTMASNGKSSRALLEFEVYADVEDDSAQLQPMRARRGQSPIIPWQHKRRCDGTRSPQEVTRQAKAPTSPVSKVREAELHTKDPSHPPGHQTAISNPSRDHRPSSNTDLCARRPDLATKAAETSTSNSSQQTPTSFQAAYPHHSSLPSPRTLVPIRDNNSGLKSPSHPTATIPPSTLLRGTPTPPTKQQAPRRPASFNRISSAPTAASNPPSKTAQRLPSSAHAPSKRHQHITTHTADNVQASKNSATSPRPRPDPQSRSQNQNQSQSRSQIQTYGSKVPMTPFEEFVHAWRHTRPGGFFAQQHQHQQQKQKDGALPREPSSAAASAGGVNVLAWCL